MSDTLSFAEITSQHADLLPARTVLSMFIRDTSGSSNSGPELARLVTSLISHSTPGVAGASEPGPSSS